MDTNINHIDTLATEKRNAERGASMVEYALLVALIAVVCIGAVTTLGGNTRDQFLNLASKLTGAASTTTPPKT